MDRASTRHEVAVSVDSGRFFNHFFGVFDDLPPQPSERS
jgi:hypothetical protein